jgi:glutamine amidotransferase
MQTIAIIDYQMGNVRSVQKALTHVAPNARILLTNDIQQINDAERVVFPGQGAMGACMQALNQRQLISVLQRSAQEKPFLGICLGLQLLFDSSEENGGTSGLGIIAGEVKKFPKSTLKIPHMGWNQVTQTQAHPLWHNIANQARFYSVHSYIVHSQNPELVAATTHHGQTFTCAIAQEKLFAVQFHPEKSQQDGLQLLKNFVNW